MDHGRPKAPVLRFVFALDERNRRSAAKRVIGLDPELFGSQRPLLPLVYLVFICNQVI
jgi:hypothetical protein